LPNRHSHHDTGDAANTSKFVVRRYDFRSNLLFESYPQRAISTINDNLDGRYGSR
jgi:hypothetical protein